MRRSPLLLVALVAACSSGTPKAADTASSALTEPPASPSASASPSPAAVRTTSPARLSPSPTASPAASPKASPKAQRTLAPSPTPKPTATRNGSTFTINEVAPDRFSPSTLTIRVGDSVLVTNKDVGSHTFTVPSLGKDSGNMDNGDTYTLRFGRAGTFDFVCTYHEGVGMTGRVTVKP